MTTSRNSLFFVAFTAAVSMSTIVLAAPRVAGDVASARLAWADRHVDTVCRPLAARGLHGQAKSCFEEAARATRNNRTASDATGSIGLATPVSDVAPASRKRCVGVECLKMFSSLGVGF